MKTFNAKLMISILGVTLAAGAPAAWAQSPGHAQHQPSASAPTSPHAPDGGMPMMDMCRQMMAGPMSGMMGGDQKMEPKMMAHMLQMRGEMMKAMGEVMMKHGTMMMTPDDLKK